MLPSEADLVDDIVAKFRRRLAEATLRMKHARTPRQFFDMEREVHDLARELADALTRQVLEQVAADDDRAHSATDRVRARAADKGIELRTQGRRRTPVQLLGGTVIYLETAYLCAKPRGDVPRAKRGKAGTGVFRRARRDGNHGPVDAGPAIASGPRSLRSELRVRCSRVDGAGWAEAVAPRGAAPDLCHLFHRPERTEESREDHKGRQ